jgi:hypothetical protein
MGMDLQVTLRSEKNACKPVSRRWEVKVGS